jgi:hypothetical protein
LFNYDGYIYRLQALGPFQGENINPHHVLWFPIQRAIAAVTSAAASPSPEAFQFVGILINSLTLALLCLLLVRMTRRLALPFVMTIFIAFTPRIWSLGLQNQPYPLLDLCVVAFLWTVAGWRSPSRLRLAASGLALAAAVLLQQAMALTVPAVAFGYVVAGAGPLKEKLKLGAKWAGGTTLGVAAVYAWMARAAGVRPAGFLQWTLLYLQEQHGLQVHWPQSEIKSAIGLVDTVVDSSWIRQSFDTIENSAAIWRLYGGLLVIGGLVAAALISRYSVRQRLVLLLRSDASFTSVLMLVLAWSGFVFLWEPVGHFWSVLLFPLAFLASWWVRATRKRTALLVGGTLLLVSAWNLRADHRQDRAYSVNYPPPMLEQIRAELGPNDVFIVAGRDWYANIDYDLLLACLDDWPNDPALDLFDDYVMKRSSQPWQENLDHDLQAVFATGGRVYVADHIFWPESYRDLEQTADPFSEYAREEFAGVNGEILKNKVSKYFGHYKMSESTFRIGADRYRELKQIK